MQLYMQIGKKGVLRLFRVRRAINLPRWQPFLIYAEWEVELLFAYHGKRRLYLW